MVSVAETGSPSRMVLIIDDGRSITYEAVKPAFESPAQLAEWAGRYYSEELDTEYTLTIQGNKLLAGKKTGDDLLLAPQYVDVFGDSDSLISARFTRGGWPGHRFLAEHEPDEGIVFQKTVAPRSPSRSPAIPSTGVLEGAAFVVGSSQNLVC